MDKRLIWPFRIVMLLISVPFTIEVYDVLVSGVAEKGSYSTVRGEHWGYYTHLFKYVMFALLFLWMGSFGVTERKPKENHNST